MFPTNHYATQEAKTKSPASHRIQPEIQDERKQMPLEPAPMRVPSEPGTGDASSEVDSAILETIRSTVTGRGDALAYRQALNLRRTPHQLPSLHHRISRFRKR